MPVANANAEAAWPDGKELLAGTRARRDASISLESGRRRRVSGLIRRFAAADAAATDVTPRAAARRPDEPRVAARTAAQTNHSRE